jgi:hypothetical protein
MHFDNLTREVAALRYQVRDRGYGSLQQAVGIILDEKYSILANDIGDDFSALGTKRRVVGLCSIGMR